MTQKYDDASHHQNNDPLDIEDSHNYEHQQKQVLDQLLVSGHVSTKNGNRAARVLNLYPSKQSWLSFFDKMLLVFGSVSLVLAVVFFIAYNWINMGTLSKFALVESALVISIVAYSVLAYKNSYKLVQQLLLLIASMITGSLLALFGQVYQTGADTWQLFATWALFIAPWVFIARMPALWLIWIGLINISFGQFFNIFEGPTPVYALSEFTYLIILFTFNFIAFNLWISCTSKAIISKSSLSKTIGVTSDSQTFLMSNPLNNPSNNQLYSVTNSLSTDKLKLHWGAYVIGLIAIYYATFLGAFHTIWSDNLWISLITFVIWLSFCGFIYWRFRKTQIDLLMLTALCGSAIIVLMFWMFECLVDDLSTFGFLILTLALVGTSSAAVSWLNKLRKMDTQLDRNSAVNNNENLASSKLVGSYNSNKVVLPQNKRGNTNDK